ncbi:MAG: DUF2141 domain-containing protein [Lentisphaeria bacterium]|nr:DUF2141 domain-containing protein [Lentisphaeria bacterium]
MRMIFWTVMTALLTAPVAPGSEAAEPVEKTPRKQAPAAAVSRQKDTDAPEKQAATVTVRVKGLKNSEGNVLISLFNQADGFPANHEKALRAAVIPAGKLNEVVFKDLPRGTYAVAVCHDENESMTLETGFFGKPKEGVGTSNNVRKKTRAPTFSEASFKALEPRRDIEITIQY